MDFAMYDIKFCGRSMLTSFRLLKALMIQRFAKLKNAPDINFKKIIVRFQMI